MSKTHIANLGLAVVPRQQHIAALDVPMQHPMRVQEVQPLDDIKSDVGALVVPLQLLSSAVESLQSVPQVPSLGTKSALLMTRSSIQLLQHVQLGFVPHMTCNTRPLTARAAGQCPLLSASSCLQHICMLKLHFNTSTVRSVTKQQGSVLPPCIPAQAGPCRPAHRSHRTVPSSCQSSAPSTSATPALTPSTHESMHPHSV